MRIRLLILALAVCSWACSSGPSGSSVSIIHHVRGYTLVQGSWVSFSAMAMDSGRVLRIGTLDQLQQAYGEATLIDGQGRTLLPGLIDAHGHVMGLGREQMMVQLTGTKSIAEAMQKVKSYAAEHPQQTWVIGRGWNQVLWADGRFPTAADIDAVVADKPVWLVRVDGHAAVANTKALELAGIHAGTPDPQGGKLMRFANGWPTGLLVDGAMDLLWRHVPAPTAAEDSVALQLALQQLRSVGLTGTHDAGITASTWALYKRFADQGLLTTRIYAMIGGAGQQFDVLSKQKPIPSYAHDLLALRSVKLYQDGALGSRGAALLAPYTDEPNNMGLQFMPTDSLTKLVNKCAALGYQVNIHAIGDRANRSVLDAFAASNAQYKAAQLRHRVEHAQVVAPDDFSRFKELGIIASMQPTHATSDKNMAEARLGPQRILGAYAWQRFLKQGTIVAAGSDYPVESPNPFYGLHAAITRQDSSNAPAGGWYPTERLTLAQALRAFTLDAAYAAHQEAVLGSLEPGKWADFILIDRDIFDSPPAQLWQTRVLQTWVAGKPVYTTQP